MSIYLLPVLSFKLSNMTQADKLTVRHSSCFRGEVTESGCARCYRGKSLHAQFIKGKNSNSFFSLKINVQKGHNNPLCTAFSFSFFPLNLIYLAKVCFPNTIHLNLKTSSDKEYKTPWTVCFNCCHC